MIINLEELSKAGLQHYIDDFDIDEEIMLWWSNGLDEAKKRGLPFGNIRDHYNDLENWLSDLQEICDNTPN